MDDSQAIQKVTADEIGDMKNVGSSGQEIIAKLMANSATFQGKTQFSKEKWIKRKQ